MTASSETVDALQERANDLYWNSPDPVDSVAEELGMKRSALYAAVRPIPAGAECPDCGEELVFPNRSSRTARRAMCLACNRTVALDEVPASKSARGPRIDDGHGYAGRDTGYGEGGGRLRHWREGLAAVEPERAARLGGAAALGVVVGAAAATLYRRMGGASPD
ncbi:MAG TPA: hypothetical protein VHG28_02825 [Longimicrobiaceae bacterium]|nr:hypothetical protein [Longimicrobiaceae bacterium]